jgi:hypothetical protein
MTRILGKWQKLSQDLSIKISKYSLRDFLKVATQSSAAMLITGCNSDAAEEILVKKPMTILTPPKPSSPPIKEMTIK